MSTRQQRRHARQQQLIAAKRQSTNGDPSRVCALEFDIARAQIRDLPHREQPEAWRALTAVIREFRTLLPRR